MAWPPTDHQDVEDEVTAFRALGDLNPIWPIANQQGKVFNGGAHTSTPQDVAIYYPVTFLRACTLSELRVNASQAIASTSAVLGVYSATTAGLPGTLLGSGTVDTSTTGAKIATVSIAVTRGLHFFALASTGGNCTLWGAGANQNGLGTRGTLADNLARTTVYKAAVTTPGSLDTTAPTVTVAGDGAPNIGFLPSAVTT